MKEMSSSVPTELPARSAKDDKREAIVAIAQESFVTNGYDGTSMSAIAARLGGSKGTLYNYFKNKEELFVAVVEKKCQQIQGLLEEAEIEASGDLKTTITSFATHFLELILNDDSIATYRLATAESGRRPEIGNAIYYSGVAQNHRRFAQFLEHAKEAGQLRSDTDTSVAAEQFLDMCLMGIHRRRLWNVKPAPTAAEIAKNVADAVTTFMRAFGKAG